MRLSPQAIPSRRLIVIVLLHAAHNSASTWIEDHNYAFYSATGGVALVMGILAVKFARTLIIVATSFSGAYSIMSAIDGFAENGRLSVSLLSSISSESPSVFQRKDEGRVDHDQYRGAHVELLTDRDTT